METFESVLSYLNTIPNINRGGCGISAMAMCLWLESKNQLCVDDGIIYLYKSDRGLEFENNNRLVQTHSSKNATACSHAIFQHNGQYYDSKGLFAEKDCYTFEHKLPIDIVRITLNANNWNTAFLRDVYVKEIESKLGINIIQTDKAKKNRTIFGIKF